MKILFSFLFIFAITTFDFATAQYKKISFNYYESGKRPEKLTVENISEFNKEHQLVSSISYGLPYSDSNTTNQVIIKTKQGFDSIVQSLENFIDYNQIGEKIFIERKDNSETTTVITYERKSKQLDSTVFVSTIIKKRENEYEQISVLSEKGIKNKEQISTYTTDAFGYRLYTNKYKYKLDKQNRIVQKEKLTTNKKVNTIYKYEYNTCGKISTERTISQKKQIGIKYFTYNAACSLTKEEETFGPKNALSRVVTIYEYDDKNRVTKETTSTYESPDTIIEYIYEDK
jgi:hypothetical protein